MKGAVCLASAETSFGSKLFVPRGIPFELALTLTSRFAQLSTCNGPLDLEEAADSAGLPGAIIASQGLSRSAGCQRVFQRGSLDASLPRRESFRPERGPSCQMFLLFLVCSSKSKEQPGGRIRTLCGSSALPQLTMFIPESLSPLRP